MKMTNEVVASAFHVYPGEPAAFEGQPIRTA